MEIYGAGVMKGWKVRIVFLALGTTSSIIKRGIKVLSPDRH
jgi:hypothetical protein